MADRNEYEQWRKAQAGRATGRSHNCDYDARFSVFAKMSQASASDGHHEISVSGADSERVHNCAESGAPMWPLVPEIIPHTGGLR